MARDQLFISYSRKDKDWLERLQTMLAPLTRAGFKIWADTDIKPGAEWKKSIEQALGCTKVAVLLVSPDFLASRFIHESELPPLLDAAQNAGLTILWVLVRPCYYRSTVIAKYQSALSPPLPLSKMDYASQEEAMVSIVEKVEEALLATPFPAIQNIQGWPAQKVQELQQQTALALGLKVEFRDTLKDGSQGPEMVVIPAGEFLMGRPKDDEWQDIIIAATRPERITAGRPQHKVVIAKAFAMGCYTVTFEEYDRFCEATGQKQPDDAGWGRGRRPVINVTWYDAVAYCTWLSQQTGSTYRLPSEAEWEYAARAGTTTAFWWGNDVDTMRANYNGDPGHRVDRNELTREYRQQTVPVDTFQPNPFGLYQVHGNVVEFMEDKWHDNYDGAPVDGSAWVEGTGPFVGRGGNWDKDPQWLCMGWRDHCMFPRYSGKYWGFRLARTFP